MADSYNIIYNEYITENSVFATENVFTAERLVTEKD